MMPVFTHPTVPTIDDPQYWDDSLPVTPERVALAALEYVRLLRRQDRLADVWWQEYDRHNDPGWRYSAFYREGRRLQDLLEKLDGDEGIDVEPMQFD